MITAACLFGMALGRSLTGYAPLLPCFLLHSFGISAIRSSSPNARTWLPRKGTDDGNDLHESSRGCLRSIVNWTQSPLWRYRCFGFATGTPAVTPFPPGLQASFRKRNNPKR